MPSANTSRLLKKLLRWVLARLADGFGTRPAGSDHKLLVVPDRQRLRVFPNPAAPEHERYVRALFQPCPRVRYGWQELAFAPWPLPNAPRLPVVGLPNFQGEVLCAILLHGDEAQTRDILRAWGNCGWSDEALLVLHGGSPGDFQTLSHTQKIYLDDERLRRSPAPLMKQSYGAVMRAVADFLTRQKEFEWVLFAEYDLVPLRQSLAAALLEVARAHDADVLFHHLQRVDGTNAPHYCHHLEDPLFQTAWQTISQRMPANDILNALVVGSLWRRQAWVDVSRAALATEVYLEMELPTTAHHLGYRTVSYPTEWSRTITATPTGSSALQNALTEDAAWLHPWKTGLGSLAEQS